MVPIYNHDAILHTLRRIRCACWLQWTGKTLWFLPKKPAAIKSHADAKDEEERTGAKDELQYEVILGQRHVRQAGRKQGHQPGKVQ